ncbi:hypothetical protein DSECCO2_644250 [anaerobic digester metagenome]
MSAPATVTFLPEVISIATWNPCRMKSEASERIVRPACTKSASGRTSTSTAGTNPYPSETIRTAPAAIAAFAA